MLLFITFSRLVLLFIDDFLTTYCYVIISQLSAQGRDFPSLCSFTYSFILFYSRGLLGFILLNESQSIFIILYFAI